GSGARNKAKPKLRDKKPNPVPRKPICTKQQSPRHQPAGRSHSGDNGACKRGTPRRTKRPQPTSYDNKTSLSTKPNSKQPAAAGRLRLGGLAVKCPAAAMTGSTESEAKKTKHPILLSGIGQ
ncbi:hypothetical protein, partial [Mesorhizobium sp. M0715]|uniref:hypothetical protein n=1 Tax=Mesorhizobium sp. M0715 TaxID=2956990 RepID=UPI003337AFCF